MRLTLSSLHVAFSLALTTFRFLCATGVAHSVIDDNGCYDPSSLTGVPELWYDFIYLYENTVLTSSGNLPHAMASPQAFPSSVPGETKSQMRTAEDYAQRGSNTTLVRSDEFELHQSKRRRLDTHNERSVCITPTEAIKHEQCYTLHGSDYYDQQANALIPASVQGGLLEWSTAGCISRETLPNQKDEMYSFGCHQNDQASFNWSLEMPLEIQYTASKSAEASPGLHLPQDATQVCSTNEVLFQSFDSSTVSLYYSQRYPPLSNHGHAAKLAYLSTGHQSTGVPRELSDSPISCSIVNDQVCFGMVSWCASISSLPIYFLLTSAKRLLGCPLVYLLAICRRIFLDIQFSY